MKRVLRYLKGTPSAALVYPWQEGVRNVTAFSDSDWAGCVKTRRSTSGGVLMNGLHTVAHWSSTQATVALSVAEAELDAMTKASVEVIGLQSLSTI